MIDKWQDSTYLHSGFLGLFIPAVFTQEGQFQNGEMGSLHAVGKSGEQAESGAFTGTCLFIQEILTRCFLCAQICVRH